MDTLKSCLLDLLFQFDRENLPLIVGGGYGLLLKQLDRMGSTHQTVIERNWWPEARSTEDIDMFLCAEIITNSGNCVTVRKIIDGLGYEEISTQSAKLWQFRQPKALNPSGKPVKIDLLTGPIPDQLLDLVKIDPSDNIERVRPRFMPDPKIHARRTQEAEELESGAISIPISGLLSNREEYTGSVRVPSAFTYLLMKLKTYKDRRAQEYRGFGMQHAIDLYRIVATMTEEEFESCKKLSNSRSTSDTIVEVSQITNEYFASDSAEGILRIKQSPGPQISSEYLTLFITVLQSIFPDLNR